MQSASRAEQSRADVGRQKPSCRDQLQQHFCFDTPPDTHHTQTPSADSTDSTRSTRSQQQRGDRGADPMELRLWSTKARARKPPAAALSPLSSWKSCLAHAKDGVTSYNKRMGCNGTPGGLGSIGFPVSALASDGKGIHDGYRTRWQPYARSTWPRQA